MRKKSVSIEAIRKLYWVDNCSLGDIGNMLGVNGNLVYRRMEEHGIPRRPWQEAQKLAFGKSNRRSYKTRTNRGYLQVYKPGHYRSGPNGYVFEHIYVWEEVHNKRLPEGWVVHHLNGIKDDNRPSNLVAMKRGAHSDLAGPFKKHIRELEAEVKLLQRALDDNQMIFRFGEN